MNFFVVGLSSGDILEDCGVFESVEEARAFCCSGHYHTGNFLPPGVVVMQVEEEYLAVAAEIARSAYRDILFYFRYSPTWMAEERDGVPLTVNPSWPGRRKELRRVYAALRAKQLPRGSTFPGQIPEARMLCRTLVTLRRRWQSIRNHYQALQMLNAQH
jgi:hypothetical protein